MARNERFLTLELGSELRRIRARVGLTQEEVATRMGLAGKGGKNQVSALESGRIARPYADTLVRYLQACGAFMSEFFDRFNRLEPVHLNPGAEQKAKVALSLHKAGPGSAQGSVLSATRKQANKWLSRSVRPVRARPLARERARQGAEKLAEYRLLANVVKEAVRRYLATTRVNAADQFKYQVLAQAWLGALGRKDRRAGLKPDKFVAQQNLDSEVSAQVKRTVADVLERMGRAKQD